MQYPLPVNKQPPGTLCSQQAMTLQHTKCLSMDCSWAHAANLIFACSIHWLVTNIPKDAVQRGQGVLEYAPPAPPPGSGFHRYIFRLYSQGEDTIQVGHCSCLGRFVGTIHTKPYGL